MALLRVVEQVDDLGGLGAEEDHATEDEEDNGDPT